MHRHTLVPGVNGVVATSPDVLLMVGCAAEAAKIVPVASVMRRRRRMRPVLVAGGRRPELVRHALEGSGLCPEVALVSARDSVGEAELASRLVAEMDRVLRARRPAAVLVYGDTTTTLAAALASFWRRVPVVHLAAGLRSFDLTAPFPEEANRRMVAQLASLHLPATPSAARNLAEESLIGPNVVVVGDTAVDAALAAAERTVPFTDPRLEDLVIRVRSGAARLVLAVVHHRDTRDDALHRVLRALGDVVLGNPGVELVLSTHPHPAVRAAVYQALGRLVRVIAIEPPPSAELARLLPLASLAVTDTVELQQEAPSFGVPVLVLREATEHPEAVEAGCAQLVGTDRLRITRAAGELLRDRHVRADLAARGNPFGDGHAAERVEQALAWMLGLQDERPAEFTPRAPVAA
ncbi:non-hydrolyzing UDP-N-acetylglucosamine 2-epimerase [Gandjariella thermophila]|uniref:UDP-N-acetylglucosamine 2-epimerase (non-hydrolyzing) n=1 Tax=Gandjariella thermophila TaxID=1931992 RepID=A0A4D4J6G8_9PSEU|nr:UDP-N-acetylglucosamine 2-epimerase (non-hydrolyzing) [Gandjariella thermophila]GDY29533.1 UDP-N-acetyl glucosamine 2-epimerase [Gandjariella thermophila]